MQVMILDVGNNADRERYGIHPSKSSSLMYCPGKRIETTDFECLVKFQRQSLREIQGLPDKTPDSITLALLGVLPLKTVIHKNVLNLFMNIARLSDSVEIETAKRQLAMKESHEKSWFNYVKKLLDLYGLPSIFELFETLLPKLAWKHLLNNSRNFATEAEWKSDIEQKPSLKYVNPETLGVGKCHPIWSTVRNNLTDSRKAQLKCKLLTGSYILQGNMAVFNQYQVDPTLSCALSRLRLVNTF